MQEQWEKFIQHLTNQQVREVTVKTADDRLAVIWPEKIPKMKCSDERLEKLIQQLIQRHGKSFIKEGPDLVTRNIKAKMIPLFDN